MADIAMCTGARLEEDAPPLRLCHACRRFTEPASELRQVWIEPAARRVAGTSRFTFPNRLDVAEVSSLHAPVPAYPAGPASRGPRALQPRAGDPAGAALLGERHGG